MPNDWNWENPDPADVKASSRKVAEKMAEAGIRYITEFEFDKRLPGGAGKRYRSDLYLPDYRIAIEAEGGLGSGVKGAHSSYYGVRRDIAKYSLAQALHGICVYRHTTDVGGQLMVAGFVIRHIQRLRGELDRDGFLEFLRNYGIISGNRARPDHD